MIILIKVSAITSKAIDDTEGTQAFASWDEGACKVICFRPVLLDRLWTPRLKSCTMWRIRFSNMWLCYRVSVEAC